MQLLVGGYTHDDNSVWISPLVIRRVPSQRGRNMLLQHRWGVHGVLVGTSQSNLTSKIAALETGYRNITGDVLLKDNSGTNSAHTITYANTVNGIRASITYPGSFAAAGWGSGSEYTYIRYFVAQIEADVLSIDDNILLYHQTMQFSLGGSGYKVMEAFTGPPQVQFTKQQSKFWGIQRGMAIGAFINPNPADPLVGVPTDPDRSWVDYGTPQIQGSLRNIGFPTRWSYYFESPFPLVAVPPPNP